MILSVRVIVGGVVVGVVAGVVVGVEVEVGVVEALVFVLSFCIGGFMIFSVRVSVRTVSSVVVALYTSVCVLVDVSDTSTDCVDVALSSENRTVSSVPSVSYASASVAKSVVVAVVVDV